MTRFHCHESMPNATAKTWVLHHAECLDGFGAAWAAWKSLGGEAQYQPVRHGDPAPGMPAGRIVYILDFCYSPEQLVGLAATADRVVVLDHHESARKAFECAVQDGLETPPNLNVHFDMDHSGCVLAWHHFHPGQPLPALLAHIEDRDLWRHELPGTREINQALFLRLPIAFEDLEQLCLRELEQEGRVLCRQQQQSVQRLMKSRHKIRLGEFEGLAVNAPPQFASDLGEALARASGTFGLVYHFNGQRQRWDCSLRSRGEFNVARLAIQLGGGGHRNAAGFTLSASETPLSAAAHPGVR